MARTLGALQPNSLTYFAMEEILIARLNNELPPRQRDILKCYVNFCKNQEIKLQPHEIKFLRSNLSNYIKRLISQHCIKQVTLSDNAKRYLPEHIPDDMYATLLQSIYKRKPGISFPNTTYLQQEDITAAVLCDPNIYVQNCGFNQKNGRYILICV